MKDFKREIDRVIDEDVEIIYRRTKGGSERTKLHGYGIMLLHGAVRVMVNVLLEIIDNIDDWDVDGLIGALTDYIKQTLKEELEEKGKQG